MSGFAPGEIQAKGKVLWTRNPPTTYTLTAPAEEVTCQLTFGRLFVCLFIYIYISLCCSCWVPC